jgi:hypothetical protein
MRWRWRFWSGSEARNAGSQSHGTRTPFARDEDTNRFDTAFLKTS